MCTKPVIIIAALLPAPSALAEPLPVQRPPGTQRRHVPRWGWTSSGSFCLRSDPGIAPQTLRSGGR